MTDEKKAEPWGKVERLEGGKMVIKCLKCDRVMAGPGTAEQCQVEYLSGLDYECPHSKHNPGAI